MIDVWRASGTAQVVAISSIHSLDEWISWRSLHFW